MKFEWDKDKNEINIRKHRIDFEDVPEMFDGPMIVNVDYRVDYSEDRLIGIGLLNNMIIIVAFVEKDEDTIRIISARKANKHESKRFQKEVKDRLG